MARRQKRSAAQWEKIIRDQERSGLNQTEYCKKHGISDTSYWKWRQKLRNATCSFVELPITKQTEMPDLAGVVEVVFPSGMVLRMRP